MKIAHVVTPPRMAAFFTLILLSISQGLTQAGEPAAIETPTPPKSRMQFDVLGDIKYSHYNFTDLKNPYNGFDAFGVFRMAYWLDEARSFGPFAELVPSYSSEDEFFFQRYVQYNLGVQWYPLDPKFSWDPNDPYSWLQPFRLFAQWSPRTYYDEPSGISLEDHDVQAGLDYFLENLGNEDSWYYLSVFSNLTYRETNHSFDNYSAVVWSGNVKWGPIFRQLPLLPDGSALVAYGVLDWTSVPEHEERFFENFLRVGGGLRYYPQEWRYDDVKNLTGGEYFRRDFLGRTHFFVEALHNASWLGDRPANHIEETDIRFGVQVATGGFVRRK